MSDKAASDNDSKRVTVRRALNLCTTVRRQLIARKPMRDIQNEIETNNEMRRTLNWFQLTGIGLGGIIGGGIFVLSVQVTAKYSGPAVIICFILAGIVALLASFSMAEMAAMMSSSGSAYTYTYAALGEYCAWIVACNLTLIYLLSASTVVVSWSKHVVHFINIVSDYNVSSVFFQAPVDANAETIEIHFTGGVLNLPAILITVGITLLLITGIRQTATVNLVLVILKVIVLLIFIFTGFKYINASHFTPFIPPNEGSFDRFGVTGVLKGSTSVFFAYVGFESVAAAAQEAKKPTRTIPISIIGALVISMLLYLGVSIVLVGLVPYTSLDPHSPLSEAIKHTPQGFWLSILMDLGAIIGLTTVALTIMLSQTRVLYAMAHDGLLPPIFAKIQSRTKTPWVTILISGILCAVLAGICPVDILGETTSISALIIYIFVHISVIVMRYTHGDMPRTFQVPFGTWPLQTLGILLCLLLLMVSSKATGTRLAIYMGIGQVIYFSYGFWHSKRRKQIREASIVSMTGNLPTVEGAYVNHSFNDSEEISVNETTA